MTPELLTAISRDFDDAFFLIGGAILAVEVLKGIFTGGLTSRALMDMVSSVSTQIPYLLVETFLLSFVYIGFVWVSDTFISWSLPLTVGTALLAVLAADFIYYWEHRFAHEIRLFWTQHAVHHSSRYMNMTVAVRFGPLEGVISALIHFPLIFVGFPAELVFFGIVIVLAYQTWLHTELIGRLGPLEGILNTPANHRVHHGCDDKYIDKNYGGILIIWDRFFGTWQREEETPRYGLKRDYSSTNPLSVWISEWPVLFADLKSARSFREAWMYLFRRPGWAPKRVSEIPISRPNATSAPGE